jgi:hypothetical protein
MSKNKRTTRLIADPILGKMWAAIMALGGPGRWVSIDAIGDFLRKRQLDATAVHFVSTDPSTRYAIPPSVLRKRGWDDSTIAHTLARGYELGLFDQDKAGELNVFRAKKDDGTNLWKLQDTSVPINPAWALPPSIT